VQLGVLEGMVQQSLTWCDVNLIHEGMFQIGDLRIARGLFTHCLHRLILKVWDIILKGS
jgi:hypothetical protein